MKEKQKEKQKDTGNSTSLVSVSINKKVIMQQIVNDNNKQIEELLIDLNIIDDFSEANKDKIIELGLALISHNGKFNAIDEE